MPTEDLNARVMRLAGMLERFRAPNPNPGSTNANPVVAHLESIPDERLRNLGAMLKERIDEGQIDAEDALLLRLLLDEYTAAVRQLRGAADIIDQRLNNARSAVSEGRRLAAAERARVASSNPPGEP